MQSVNVGRQGLIEVLKKNREKHAAAYAAALPIYRDKLARELRAIANLAADCADADAAKLSQGVFLPTPQSFLDQYDAAIAMAEASVDPQITLTQQEFQCYFLDKWQWAPGFAASTGSYIR